MAILKVYRKFKFPWRVYMIIKQKKKRYNPEIKRREEYFDDREFHSLLEIKAYCIDDANRYMSLYDNVIYKFVVMETDEEIEISTQWCKDDDNSYYVKLDFWF